jgi:hypothetical protein
MIAISAEDEFADKINDVDDIEEYYPGNIVCINKRCLFGCAPPRSALRLHVVQGCVVLGGFDAGTVSGVREWFRWYKTPDDKPVNGFGHGEKALGAAKAKEVIEETHGFYKNLLSGAAEKGKLWLP